MTQIDNYKKAVEHYNAAETDVIIYSGGIGREGYEAFCDAVAKPRRQKLLLVLSTFGGDPNAGYRIARAALHHYGAKNFQILIPGYCKSAGTLICIGANSLIMANRSELGPLDIQLRKQDELFQQSSGLDILRGVTHLREEALSTFRSYLLNINAGSGLSTKVASEISSNLVRGLYEPLFAQVDPIRLGEMSAALQIAKEYGERLDKKAASLQSGALNKLIMDYPTHGFVIDRSEARDLFKRVTVPSEYECILCDFLEEFYPVPSSGLAVLGFNEIFNGEQNDEQPAQSEVIEGTVDGRDPATASEHREDAADNDGRSPEEHVEIEHLIRGQQGDEIPAERTED